MYKLLFILALALTTQTVQAREKRDDTKYLAKGVVPTDNNGIVTFTQAFAVPGKSAAEIYNTMKQYLEGVEEAAMHDLRTKFMEQDAAAGLLVLRAEEWMVFKHKVFNLDRTRFRYHYQVKCSDGRCDMTITQITYYYEEDLDGSNGKTYKAEEWITDEEALNRKGTKLLPYSGKFRRKTVDRVEALFDGARQCFEEPEPAPVVQEKKRSTQVIK